MTRQKKTTLEHIAEAAGVSLSTVDRVMNRRGGVSPKKEALVLDWASRLNVDRVLFKGYMRVLHVAVLMQSPHNPFYRSLRDAFVDSGAAMSEMRINCFVHYVDLANMAGTVRQIEQIAGSYDALIVICPDDPDLSDALRQISDRKPVVTMVTDMPASGRLSYIGPDNRQMGRVAGELMGRFIGVTGGDILVVLGMHNMTGHEERATGFRAVIEAYYPQCHILDYVESREDRGRAGEVVSNALMVHRNIRGIYNVSSGNANIARSIQSSRRKNDVVLITHELTPERRHMLRAGIIDAIIDQNPVKEARRAIEVVARHFNRSQNPAPSHGHTPFSIYIRENCPRERDPA